MRPHKIPAIENNLYTSPPRGAYCLCSLPEQSRPCRRSAGDLSNGENRLPASSSPGLEPPVSERNVRGTAFGIRVAHRGWAPLALIITAGNEVFIVGQRSPSDIGSLSDSFRLLLFLFLAGARITRPIEMSGGGSDHDFGHSQIDIIVLRISEFLISIRTRSYFHSAIIL